MKNLTDKKVNPPIHNKVQTNLPLDCPSYSDRFVARARTNATNAVSVYLGRYVSLVQTCSCKIRTRFAMYYQSR